MANPLFNVLAAARLDVTPGSSSHDAYFTLVRQYQFGVSIIYGVAPEALAASIAVPFISGVTDPGVAASIPSVIVVSFPNPTPSVVVSGTPYPVSTAVGGGTITGANYTDANGVLHPDIDWQWTISVEPYLNLTPGTIGRFDLQVVQFTGDGVPGKSVPTSFPLNVGVVAIWLCGKGGSEVNCFRHNAGTMLGTSVMGEGLPPHTTSGIMSFTSTGFTVTAGSSFGVGYGNTAGVKYTAIVMRDTTADNRYLRVGTYTGVSGLSLAVHIATIALPQIITAVGGTILLPEYAGLVFTDSTQATGTYTIGYDPVGNFYFLNRLFGGSIGNISLTYGANPRTVVTAGKATQLTHLWDWGRGVAYRSSTDFVGDSSVSLATEAYPVTDVIRSMGAATFTVGTQNNTNNALTPYDYMALSADGNFTSFFLSFKITGTASPPVVVPLPFTPGVAFIREYTTTSAGAIWRGLDHTGTDSQVCQTAAGFADQPNDGIVAMGAGSISIGNVAAPNGFDAYGWAFAGGSNGFVVPIPPTFVPSTPLENSDPSVSGCVSQIVPGAGNVGGAGCAASL